MMNLFDDRGAFIALDNEQLGQLNAQQRKAYNNVAGTAAALKSASAAADAASTDAQRCVRAVADAEVRERGLNKWTPLDEIRAAIGSPDARRAPPPDHVLANARTALSDAQSRLRAALDRQSSARAAAAHSVERWQVATATTLTFDQLAQEYCRQQNEERAERARLGRPPAAAPRLRSEIDAFAWYTKKQGRRSGGGRAFARGGLTQAQAMARATMRDHENS